MWIERVFSADLSKLAPIGVLLGPRQVGKTSLMLKTLGDGARVLSCDDLSIRHALQTEPSLTLGSLDRPLLIDEAQYAPNLFPELKLRIDQSRAKGINLPSIWITGSNLTLLSNEVRETLAGRATWLRLHPLSVSELAGFYRFSDALMKGGYPELYRRPEIDPIQYFNDYILTFIEKDVAQGAGIQKLNEFQKAMRLLSGRISQILNLSEIGAQAGVKSQTLEDWISVLEQNNLVARVQPFYSNINKRLIKSPKFYFLDIAVAVRLQGWRAAEPLLLSPSVGAFFENLVLTELIRARDHYRLGMDLYYWRSKEKEEVDFLIRLERERNAPAWIAIEVKYSSQTLNIGKIPAQFVKDINQTGEELIGQWLVTPDEQNKSSYQSGWKRVGIQNLTENLVKVAK